MWSRPPALAGGNNHARCDTHQRRKGNASHWCRFSIRAGSLRLIPRTNRNSCQIATIGTPFRDLSPLALEHFGVFPEIISENLAHKLQIVGICPTWAVHAAHGRARAGMQKAAMFAQMRGGQR